MRTNRTLHVIDEIEERLKQQKAFEESESKRDMTYEEFLGKYQDHIEGRGEPDERQIHRPVTAEGNESREETKAAKPEQKGEVEEVKVVDEGAEGQTDRLNESHTKSSNKLDDSLNRSS